MKMHLTALSFGAILSLVFCDVAFAGSTTLRASVVLDGKAPLGLSLAKDQCVSVTDSNKSEVKPASTSDGGSTVSTESIVTDVLVGIAGKAAESLIDAVAAKTRKEATTLETVVPLNAFFDANKVLLEGGCLVFHNGLSTSNVKDATFVGVFKFVVSPDQSAFALQVLRWSFSSFVKPYSQAWFQSKTNKDFLLKIDWLSPGSADLGHRSVFIEKQFSDVTVDDLNKVFSEGDILPWFAVPTSNSVSAKGKNTPLNIDITVIETTKPKQIADWLNSSLTEKKSDISNLVQDAVKKSLDPNYAASQLATSAASAGTAFAAYKLAWDNYAAKVSDKPSEPSADASDLDRKKYDAAVLNWKAALAAVKAQVASQQYGARAAYSNASIPWPGDLPYLDESLVAQNLKTKSAPSNSSK